VTLAMRCEKVFMWILAIRIGSVITAVHVYVQYDMTECLGEYLYPIRMK
jgi:hypothetical protein